MTFKKRIGTERTLLMLPLNIVMAGRVIGAVDPEAVALGLAKLRIRHKQLAVRVQFDSDGTGWYVSDDVPDVPVKAVDGEWLDQIRTEYQTPFPIEKGPMVRCALVPSENGCDILLTGHHAICDGTSLAYLLRDLLQAITHPDAPVMPLPEPPPIDASTVPSPPRITPVMRWMMGAMNKRWVAQNHRFDESEMRRMHEVFWRRNDAVRILTWTMDNAATERFSARCRAERVTVNSAIWTALLHAQETVQTDKKGYRRSAALAVSTREKLNVPVGELLGFYASSLSMSLPKVGGRPFWEAARSVHRAIHKQLARTDLFRMLVADLVHPTLLDALYFQKLGLLQSTLPRKFLRKMRWHEMSYGTAFTNVGRLDLPTEYGSLKLDAVFGPFFYSDVDEKVVGGVTVGGKLTLTLTCNDAVVGAGTARKILDVAVERISNGTDSP